MLLLQININCFKLKNTKQPQLPRGRYFDLQQHNNITQILRHLSTGSKNINRNTEKFAKIVSMINHQQYERKKLQEVNQFSVNKNWRYLFLILFTTSWWKNKKINQSHPAHDFSRLVLYFRSRKLKIRE